MSGFNWKSLFVNEEGTTKQNTDSQESKNTTVMPNVSETKFPETNLSPQVPANTNNPFIGEVLDVYQKGFDGLNAEGFDFFELYKSVQAVGVTNPQSYQMAFTMGKTINSGLTKEFLLEKSKFYISEIEKVYKSYDDIGKSKNSNLNTEITNKKNTLTKEITGLEDQIAKLQTELENKKAALSKIDFENHEMFSEINLKIEANNIAKQKILESINTVVTGINQYL
jgi:hypothetical protein